MHYLDNASTTFVSQQVQNHMLAALQQHWANPAALYRAGFAAEGCITAARAGMAQALGCLPHEVFFTAGGTEANNLAIFGAVRQRAAWATQLVCSAYEHPSTRAPLHFLAQQAGFTLTQIAPGTSGNIDIGKIVAAVGKETALVSAMHVNNETGAIIDVATLAAEVKAKNPRCFVHVDGVQGFCKLPLALAQTSIDAYTISGHKLHAPKGVGAMYLRAGKATKLMPLLLGAGQEGGLRPGTENTAYIAALASAASQAMAGQKAALQHYAALRTQLLQGLATIPGIAVHSPQNAFPGIVFFSLPGGYKSEVMIHHLDEYFDVCVSGGAACSGAGQSHTLQAMGLPPQQISGALRASFCAQTTAANINALLEGIKDGLKRRAAARPGRG